MRSEITQTKDLLCPGFDAKKRVSRPQSSRTYNCEISEALFQFLKLMVSRSLLHKSPHLRFKMPCYQFPEVTYVLMIAPSFRYWSNSDSAPHTTADKPLRDSNSCDRFCETPIASEFSQSSASASDRFTFAAGAKVGNDWCPRYRSKNASHSRFTLGLVY